MVDHSKGIALFRYVAAQALRTPYEEKETGYQLRVKTILNVQEPPIKAKVGCNGSQLACSLLSCLFNLQEGLTLCFAIIPLCDERPQDLHHSSDI